MDVRDLLDIKAICDAGSYRKAAEALGVTQPTLSNRIAYLEGKLGAQLFDREHGRSRPTELAILIADRAEMIGRDAALLTKDIVRLASGQAGVVRIGMGPAPGRVLLGPIIERVATQLPQVAMEIVFGSTRALADQLQARDLDIAICHPIESPGANLTCELQLEADNVIVAHPEHAIFRDARIGIGEILRNHCIAVPFLEQRYVDMTKQHYGVDIRTAARSRDVLRFRIPGAAGGHQSTLFHGGPVLRICSGNRGGATQGVRHARALQPSGRVAHQHGRVSDPCRRPSARHHP